MQLRSETEDFVDFVIESSLELEALEREIICG